MKRIRGLDSLKGRIAAWSGAMFFLLYAIAFTLVLTIDSSNRKSEMELVLYAEAESLASYYASRGKLDFPELYQYEANSPLPIWMRVIRESEVIAATPGLPKLPVPSLENTRLTKLEIWELPGEKTLAVVRHDVWNHPGMFVEALTPFGSLEHQQHELTFVMSVTGLLLIPLAALGGRFLAVQALRPVDGLVMSIRALESDRLDKRLEAPGAVEEIEQLTREFNRLLGRLEESVAAMQRFTADASHELRTPLSILRTGLEVTLRRERPPEEYRELLRENLVEIERVQRIVEGLLTLARAQRAGGDAGREAAPGTPVDLSAVVRGAIASIRRVADDRGIELRDEIAPEVLVRGDVDKLRLLVLNLLDNAAKFTPPGRSVHVKLEDLPQHARFEVRDEGPGVLVGDRPHVFDRFFRGRGPHASGTSAGGLGLSVVRWVAETHGGEIRLVDTPEVPGATFEVTLPKLSPQPQAAAG